MCAGAEWRGVAYTNVDTARRMRGSFSAFDERFASSCGSEGGPSVRLIISRLAPTPARAFGGRYLSLLLPVFDYTRLQQFSRLTPACSSFRSSFRSFSSYRLQAAVSNTLQGHLTSSPHNTVHRPRGYLWLSHEISLRRGARHLVSRGARG